MADTGNNNNRKKNYCYYFCDGVFTPLRLHESSNSPGLVKRAIRRKHDVVSRLWAWNDLVLFSMKTSQASYVRGDSEKWIFTNMDFIVHCTGYSCYDWIGFQRYLNRWFEWSKQHLMISVDRPIHSTTIRNAKNWQTLDLSNKYKCYNFTMGIGSDASIANLMQRNR